MSAETLKRLRELSAAVQSNTKLSHDYPEFSDYCADVVREAIGELEKKNDAAR